MRGLIEPNALAYEFSVECLVGAYIGGVLKPDGSYPRLVHRPPACCVELHSFPLTYF